MLGGFKKRSEKSPRDDFVKRLMLKEYAAEVAACQERKRRSANLGEKFPSTNKLAKRHQEHNFR